jgi:hypothetical protein
MDTTSSIKGHETEKKMVSFNMDSGNMMSIQNEIDDGWAIIHLSQRGKNFIGILERNFIRYDEQNSPIVYIPPRKKIKW